jgi:hypothetical protein
LGTFTFFSNGQDSKNSIFSEHSFQEISYRNSFLVKLLRQWSNIFKAGRIK